MAKPGLRLLAEDEEDLKIISAHVQDAVVRVGDLAYLPKARRFALLLNRYRWEDDADAKNAGLRMLSGLHFENVLGVKAQNVRQDDPDAMLELLAIGFAPGADGAGTVELCLAGGGYVRLDVECIDASLRDMAGPWPAKARPKHETEPG
jgi:hypothetical protein